MSTPGTSDVKLTLIPVEAASIQTSNEDDWLDNDAAELIDPANNTAEKSIADTTVHECKTFAFNITPHVVMLDTDTGPVNVLEGECIRVGEQCFRIHIERAAVNVAPVQAQAIPQATPTSFSDDIWASEEVGHQQAHIPDPFANRHQTPVAPPARPVAATPVVHQQDPLNFLYDHHTNSAHNPNALLPNVATQVPSLPAMSQHSLSSTPNYFADNAMPNSLSSDIPSYESPINTRAPAAPQSTLSAMGTAPAQTGNVLNDLGIDASHSTITQKNYDAGKSTFLDQSPVDMLDEYLSADDEPYLRQPYVPEPHQEPLQHSPTDTAGERSKGWFNSVKSVVKNVKKSK